MSRTTLPVTCDRKCGEAQYMRPAADRNVSVNFEGIDSNTPQGVSIDRRHQRPRRAAWSVPAAPYW